MAKSSQTDLVYQKIKDEIITCEIMPGEQIVQAQLAERYGFGISPVREALQRLVQERFVQAIPRFGYLVAQVSIRDIQELFELRQILESSAVILAIERASDEQLHGLVEIANFTYVHNDRDTYSKFLAKNNVFHRSIALLSDNNRLVDAITKILGELLRVFHLGLDLRDSANEMHEEHIDLVNALSKRDLNLAKEIVNIQITRSKNRVVEALLQKVSDTKQNNIDLSQKFSF